MRTSLNGLIEIARSEGIVPAPYLDVVNVWTYGVGHTAMSGDPDPATMPRGNPDDLDGEIRRAIRLFRLRIQSYEDEVSRAVTVQLEPHQFDALVSFHFNTGGIARSSGTPKLNAGDFAGAWHVYRQWNKGTINGVRRVLDALVRRRAEEWNLFQSGEYGRTPVPVWRVTSSNRPQYSRPLRMISPPRLTEIMNEPEPAESERTSRAQSTTLQAVGVGSISTGVAGVTAVSQLDGNAQIIAVVAAVIGLAAFAWVSYRRNGRWQRGDR